MKRIRSTHILWAVAAVLLIGFYTIDVKSNEASVIPLPNFSSTAKATKAKTSEKDKNPKVNAAKEDPPSAIQTLNNAFVNIAKQAKPAVVTVTVTQTVEARQNPLAQFFGEPQHSQEYKRKGLGSGVIVSKDGYIITNNHVVEDADQVKVQLYNDEQYDAKVIGTDPQTDIAVIKIDAKNITDDNVIKLGSSNNLRVGELVMAIGSPLQKHLAQTVTMGIVSAKGRDIGLLSKQGGYENYIQTDAAINPGNSGGALVNMDGELVGINAAIASQSGGNEGIGFAVPVDIAKHIMKSIIKNGRVIRAYLGITGSRVDNTMAQALGLNVAHGVIVGGVKDGTPADKAGLKEGDVILTMNGQPVQDFESFRTQIATSSPGTKIKLGINRNGEQKTVTVTLTELPKNLAMNQNQPQQQQQMGKDLGFKVHNLTPDIAKQLQVDSDVNGVVVTDISRGSDAFHQGLRKGMVITAINHKPIKDVSDFNSAMSDVAKSKNPVALLRVNAQGAYTYIAFKLD
ncbi:MAG TPA: Do family serine endopeptidase [Balneolaceae bacterium]|nr:Do family serine endopeptidase [Balneolaceae bacterium]